MKQISVYNIIESVMILSSQTFINIVIVFLLCVVFGYLLGLTIVNTVDRRLSDISINMPKINLPRQSINIAVGGGTGESESSGVRQYNPRVNVKNSFRPYRAELDQVFNLKSPQSVVKPLQLPPAGIEGFQVGSDDSDIVNTPATRQLPSIKDTPAVRDRATDVPRRSNIPLRNEVTPPQPTGFAQNNPVNPEVIPNPAVLMSPGIAANPQIGTRSQLIIDPNVDLAEVHNSTARLVAPAPVSSTVRCQTNADCNVVYGNGRNKCLSTGQCNCETGSGTFCHYGITYYKDPKSMTDRQIWKFKFKANFDKMTVQDYYNWLMLFEEDPEKLAPRHLNNLNKLLQGEKLTLNDVPRERLPPPLTAQDYFTQLYTLDDQVNIYTPQISSTTGLQIPANYTDYADFAPAQNLKHLNVRPLTMRQEIEKVGNRSVLESLQPQISHDWDLSVGTEADPTGRMQEKNRNIVKKLRSQISNLDSYPQN
jgi:hypothetical protein